MPLNLEHTIRERAYQLWVADGCRDGLSERHWLAAEREVLAEFAATATAPKAKARAANSRAANSNVGAAKEPDKTTAKTTPRPLSKARRRAQ